jgi:SWI/SNF-related matrix-associated actin-dependent regulator 1 of chromatin subfamily A
MAYYEAEWPLLILCPASLRYTWPAEIEKFFPAIPPQSVYVATGFQDVAFVKRNDVKIVILTYSLIQNRSAVCHALKDECNFQCIIADESHNLKQKTSQRSQLIMPILNRAKRLVLLSGTPALARPVELWTQLYCLAPELFGNWSQFTKRYCDPKRKQFGRGRFTMDYSGSSNEQELHQKIRLVMVRRLKCHVLAELPPKQRSIIQVQITDRDQRKKCLETMQELNEKRVSIQELIGQEAQKADFEAKTILTQAYQQSGIAKAQAVADYLTD